MAEAQEIIDRTPAEAAARRRTFAIISHPDAGKTTLTEHLLLMGGAIHMAGEVKAKRDRRRARSDWMKIEQERGISVTTAVMTFEYGGVVFNLLDTPGHEDFQRGHLSHADRGRLRDHGDRRRQGHRERRRASCSRSAACATFRSSPSSTRWTARRAIRSR